MTTNQGLIEEGAQQQFVIFRLNETEFAAPIEQVIRIIPLTKITRVPRAPRFLEGVINLHGAVAPVVDLRKRLLLGETSYDNEARIVVVNVDEEQVGMIVDAVPEIRWLPIAAFEPPPAMIADINGVYLTGVATQDDRMFIILDLNRVLTAEELAELQESGMRAAAEAPDLEKEPSA